jgi:hypothetical protein
MRKGVRVGRVDRVLSGLCSPEMVLGLPQVVMLPFLGRRVPSGALPSCLFLKCRYKAGYDK